MKRGYWVVKRVLGEEIPAPPPNVPALPTDEAKMELTLPQALARHRADPNCATCHVHFDSMGLVFEGYGPTGQIRQTDMAGKPVEQTASFPNGAEGTGLAGLKKYIKQEREGDFLDNLCRKLLADALGRTLMLSDEPLVSGGDAGRISKEIQYRFGASVSRYDRDQPAIPEQKEAATLSGTPRKDDLDHGCTQFPARRNGFSLFTAHTAEGCGRGHVAAVDGVVAGIWGSAE